MQIPTALPALVALVYGTSIQAQSDLPSPQVTPVATHLLCRSATLSGLRVENQAHEHLGEIGDVLIDTRSGEIRFAVLELRGVIGLKEDERIVPWGYLEVVRGAPLAPACHAWTHLTEEQVMSAPKCKKGQAFDAQLDGRIQGTFGKEEATEFTADGRPALAWLRKMDGAPVRDTAQRVLGTVHEVVLAPQEDGVVYIVVDTREEGQKPVALPWSRVRFGFDGEGAPTASTPVELAELRDGPEFDEGDWQRMSSTAWMNELSAYYGCDPFWKTTRFASSLQAERP